MAQIDIRKIVSPDAETIATIKSFYLALQTAEQEFEPLRDTDPQQADLMYGEYAKAVSESETYEYYMAYADGEPAGFIEFESETEIENTYKKYLRINSLYVADMFRNQGIGSMLLDTAKARAQQQGFSYIGLGAIYGNTPAKGLYKKYGFYEYGIEYMMKV